VGILSCPEVFFVLRGRIARQDSTDAYGAYNELLHGFWGNQLNRGKLMPFLDGKASILFLVNVRNRPSDEGQASSGSTAFDPLFEFL
jgi:hypothetical protein